MEGDLQEAPDDAAAVVDLPPADYRVRVAELWVHDASVDQEVECTPEQVAFLDEVLYKGMVLGSLDEEQVRQRQPWAGGELDQDDEDEDEDEEDGDEDNPIRRLRNLAHGKMGYQKFTRYLARLLRRENPLQITPGHALWYYNRTTIAQIYFRTGRQKPAAAIKRPLMRKYDPMREIQLDTFSYQAVTRAGEREYRDLPTSFMHVLVATHTGSRVIFARLVRGRFRTSSVALALVRMIPPEAQRLVRVIRTDDGNEFRGLLREMAARGWAFAQPPPPQHAEVRLVQNTDDRTVTELGGVRHVAENKAGAMVTGRGVSPGVLAPVEVAVRTVRELIEAWKRVGQPDRRGQPWTEVLPRLTYVYNNTVHAAFGNRHSPFDVLLDPELQEHYRTQNARARARIREQQQNDPRVLRAGDFVRIRRVEGAFDKQSIPDWSYDVYQVKSEYEEQNNFTFVPLRRVRQVTREYQDPPAKNVEEPPLVHYSRLGKVKTLDIDGRPGQTLDPPPETRWNDFFQAIDATTYTQRQAKEGDFTIQIGRRRRGQRRPREDEEEVPLPPPPQELRRGQRQRRAPRRYEDEYY